MYVCYIDEAGCPGMLPSSTSPVQPALVLLGLALPVADIRAVTESFLELKRRFYPGQASRTLDAVNFEVKGAELRKSIACGTREERRHAVGVLDRTLDILRGCGAVVFGRVWLKGVGAPFNGNAVYTSSIQSMCTTFQHMLVSRDARGFIVADSRTKPTNERVSHSVFTQKFRAAGDPFDRVVETPLFGHSGNHAGLQLTDLLCSALVFPMAVHAYCRGHVANLHVRPGYAAVAERYGARLKAMQYRYEESGGRWRGGLAVSDPLAKRSGALLFGPAASSTP